MKIILELVTKDLTDYGGSCNILGYTFHAESVEELGLGTVPMEGDEVMVIDLGFWMKLDPSDMVR